MMKDATIAGSECTRKAMEVSTRNRAEGKFPAVDEEVRRNQESKGKKETIVVGGGRSSGMEGVSVVSETQDC